MSITRVLSLTILAVIAAPALAAEPVTLARLFFQDDAAKTIRWADLYAGSPPTLGPVNDVPGFPKLDPAAQSLVQMESARGLLLVGVRDDNEGKTQSGWILIDPGVDSEDHDGHSHSVYDRSPRVRAQRLDAAQGNPAHLYVYDHVFYLANDKLSGYTRLDPARIRPQDAPESIAAKAEFIPGGGGHITLAVFRNQVGYATWIDRSGDNQGRVDVTPFARREIAYSLKLPHGGLHGATANQDKVFFAPTDGIGWLRGDATAKADPAEVKLEHISLGKDANDKPIRTGAFTNLGKHTLFVTGVGPSAALQFLDASAAAPTPHKLPLNLAEGGRPIGPAVATMVGGFPMALVFHDFAAEDAAPHQVTLVELDPNGDGEYRDARVGKTLPIGRSKVDGHGGHHAAAFLADKRHAVFTNPGDGTLTVLRPRRLEITAEFTVGGTPSKIEAIGGPSGHE